MFESMILMAKIVLVYVLPHIAIFFAVFVPFLLDDFLKGR